MSLFKNGIMTKNPPASAQKVGNKIGIRVHGKRGLMVTEEEADCILTDLQILFKARQIFEEGDETWNCE